MDIRKTAIISLHIVNCFFLIIEMKCNYCAVRAESLTVMQDVFSISVSPPFFMLSYEIDNGDFVFFNCTFKCLVVLRVNLGGSFELK
jgi:hypothetical protein